MELRVDEAKEFANTQLQNKYETFLVSFNVINSAIRDSKIIFFKEGKYYDPTMPDNIFSSLTDWADKNNINNFSLTIENIELSNVTMSKNKDLESKLAMQLDIEDIKTQYQLEQMIENYPGWWNEQCSKSNFGSDAEQRARQLINRFGDLDEKNTKLKTYSYYHNQKEVKRVLIEIKVGSKTFYSDPALPWFWRRFRSLDEWKKFILADDESYIENRRNYSTYTSPISIPEDIVRAHSSPPLRNNYIQKFSRIHPTVYLTIHENEIHKFGFKTVQSALNMQGTIKLNDGTYLNWITKDKSVIRNAPLVAQPGETAIPFYTIAVPKEIPLGSWIYIEGFRNSNYDGWYKAVDRGAWITLENGVLDIDFYAGETSKEYHDFLNSLRGANLSAYVFGKGQYPPTYNTQIVEADR